MTSSDRLRTMIRMFLTAATLAIVGQIVHESWSMYRVRAAYSGSACLVK